MPHPKTGLYDPSFEHDACGVAFVVRPDGVRTHETVERALTALANLEHRGAAGADKDTGDGAGILVQIPDAFFRAEVPGLPAAYGVGMLFGDETGAVEVAVEREGHEIVCWRDVPVDDRQVGRTAHAAMPRIRQFVVSSEGLEGDALERKLYVIRRVAETAGAIVPSLSSRTLVYKGMLTAPQLARFYPDLHDQRFASALALVHSRFSTNTFPSWELAHPYRMIAHNGEINTLRGNVNWMRARESQLASELFGDDLAKVLPVDPARRLGHRDVRQRARAARARGPLAAARADDDDPGGERTGDSEELRGFYAYHGCLDRAVGRPGRDRVHRRPRHRRDARPQRPAARPLVRDLRRLGRARVRGGRPRRPAGRDRAQGPPAAGEALPRRPRRRGGSSPTRR